MKACQSPTWRFVVYARLRSEAEAGRTFVWYSTDMQEICLCDRV